MNLPFLFAKRYLFSKKSVNAINIISSISVIGVMVSSAALVILLSSFNGMEDLILSMYSKYAPEIKIEPKKGKLFSTDYDLFKSLRNNPDIKNYTEVLQEKVLLQYDGRQYIATIKGIEPRSIDQKAVDSITVSGTYELQLDSIPMAVVGAGVQANLKITHQKISELLQVYSPKKGGTNNVNPADEFNIRAIGTSGVIKYQQDFDDLIITPISFAREVLGEYNKVSAVEFYLAPGVDIDKFEKQLQKDLGEQFIVKNREEQNPSLYKNVRIERWVVFFILTLISIIAIFNIVGSLTMLVIDKKEDMKILKSLGASRSLIQQIFFLEGLMISLMGCTIGLVIGYIFYWLQDHYGLIKVTDGANMIIDSYPMVARSTDFLIVFITISLIGGIVSYFSALISVKELEMEIN